MTERDLIQQVIDTLDDISGCEIPERNCVFYPDELTDKLRAYLAHAPAASKGGEPDPFDACVCYRTSISNCPVHGSDPADQAPAEPVAVVVDTGDRDVNGCPIFQIMETDDAPYLPDGTKLYATPPTAQPPAEPVAHVTLHQTGLEFGSFDNYCISAECDLVVGQPLYATPPAVQAPAEPVAWMCPGGDVSRSLKYFEDMGFSNCVPLYAAPPAAQPPAKPVAWRDPAYELTARLCAIGTVSEKDGYELIRRDSVMDFVIRWRMARDKMPTPYATPPDAAAEIVVHQAECASLNNSLRTAAKRIEEQAVEIAQWQSMFEETNKIALERDAEIAKLRGALGQAKNALSHMCHHTRAKPGYRGEIVDDALQAIDEVMK